MATPLTATHRLTFQYNVVGFTHKYRAYVKRSGITTDILKRDGTTIDFAAAAQAYWNTVRAAYPTSVGPASVLFEAHVGALWLPISAATLTGSGASGAGYSRANQLTVVLRDTAFKKIRAVWVENVGGYIGHEIAPGSFGPSIDPLIENLIGTDADPDGAYTWQKSRGDNYILITGALAGATFDLNDKLKRARGDE